MAAAKFGLASRMVAGVKEKKKNSPSSRRIAIILLGTGCSILDGQMLSPKFLALKRPKTGNNVAVMRLSSLKTLKQGHVLMVLKKVEAAGFKLPYIHYVLLVPTISAGDGNCREDEDGSSR